MAPFRGAVTLEENAYLQRKHEKATARCTMGLLIYLKPLGIHQALYKPLDFLRLDFTPVAALFSNLLRCFGRGSTTHGHFQMGAPTSQEYT